jgi:hypothetical protein
MRAELPLEVTTPLTLALDVDVTVFAFTTAVELSPEIGRSDTGHQHRRSCWHACAIDGARVTDGAGATVSVHE